MNETNLTQHDRSTDVNASEIFSPRDTKKILRKKGNFLRTTSFYGNSCCVRILINIIKVSIKGVLVTKALKCESEN